MRIRPAALTLAAVSLGLLLAACDAERAGDRPNAVNGVPDEQLPAPEGAPGSAVTGMPDAPGPGQVGPPVAGQPGEVSLDENGNPVPIDGLAGAGLPADGVPVDPNAVPLTPADEASDLAGAGPSAAEAVAVIRDYYAAINAQNYAQAFALWSEAGRATGQSPEQFANGFARTNGVSVEVREPGRIDAAAGARYIEVPVALSSTLDDGGQREFVGMYTLRRSVVDGATAEQRAWRITSADLREVQP